MKIALALSVVLASAAVSANENIEIPIYPDSSIEYNDTMQASKPNHMMRDLTYTSPASTEELLDFYRNSPFIKKCAANDMADNYLCEFNEHDGVILGTLAIDKKARRGKTEVYANYFYTK